MVDNNGWSFEQRLDYLKKCSVSQWEEICKRCGICCLKKIYDPTTGITGYTRLSCENLNTETGQCLKYQKRLREKNCAKVDLKLVLEAKEIPASCGYLEFLYGPALVPASVDFRNVRPHPTNIKLTEFDVMRNLIPESIFWNRLPNK